MHERLRSVAYAGGLALALLIGWELAVRLFQVPPRLLPPPTAIVAAGLARTDLIWPHGLETFRAIAIGFAGSIVIGVGLATLMTSVWWIEAAIFPLIVVSQTVPKVAIAPLLMIWFGFGIESKVIIAFLIAFFPILIDTMLGLRSTPPDMLVLARSAGAGPVATFLKFRFPHALPFIFAGVRTAAVFAVTGTAVAEFVGGEKGLVYLLLVAQGQYQTAFMFWIVLLLSLIGIALLTAVEFAERWIIPWHVAMRAQAR
jgi:NitT/TauT family transport system permease protein